MEVQKVNKVRKTMIGILLVFLLPIIGYFVYTYFNDNFNSLVYKILMGVWLAIYMVLFDFIEPYLLKQLQNLAKERRNSYLSFVALDVICIACLAYIVFSMGNKGGSNTLYIAILFLAASKYKVKYKKEFLNEPTKEEVSTYNDED
jgi:uncharacterized membrane protein